MKFKNSIKVFAAFSLLITTFHTQFPGFAKEASAFNPAKIKFHLIATGLTQPVFITNAGDGSGRLFIVERAGRIRILKNGSLLPTPFLDIRSIVNSSGGEEGLLSLAFHPNYETNGQFYTVHTGTNGSLILSRFTRSSANSDQADPNSIVTLLTVSHPTYQNHNGGTLAFGPDGYLYWSTGDGGSGGDPSNNAQNLKVLLGKVLRLDVDSASPYAVPPTNPFFNNTDPSVRKEIWAYGLRNPYRFSFDRQTGDLYIGDVGQNAHEEVDFQPANDAGGENYGWRVMEGSFCYNPASGCNKSGKVLPVAQYNHSTGCAVTGGYVYRGTQNPPLQGYYFYGDYCTGVLFSLIHDPAQGWTAKQIVDTPFFISSFGEDESGELYLTNYSGGRIYRIQYGQDLLAPGDVTDLTATTGANNGTVNLSWTAAPDDAGNSSSGPVTSYLVRYSTSAISNETEWNNATVVNEGLPAPTVPGATQTMIVSGLQSNTLYYFAVRARDEQSNQSVGLAMTSTSTRVPTPMPAGVYDDTDPEWNYSTGWMTATPSSAYNGTLHYSIRNSTNATFIFQAPAYFNFYYAKFANRGKFRIYVDGNFLATINAYAATKSWQNKFTSPLYMDNLAHTVKILNVAPNGKEFDIDAIEVLDIPPPAGPTQTYDDTDAHWIYSGIWKTSAPSGPYNNTIHYTTQKGATASLIFQGPATFTFYYAKFTNRGKFRIYVDGVFVTTINAYATTKSWQNVYVSNSYTGVHTLMIQNMSTREMDVDAVVIQ